MSKSANPVAHADRWEMYICKNKMSKRNVRQASDPLSVSSVIVASLPLDFGDITMIS